MARDIFADLHGLTLENGMQIWVKERFSQPAVAVQCHVRTGSIHEGEYLGYGLSHFLEHMLFQGCRDYPGTAAGDRIHALGGSANAYTSYDHTVYHAEVPGSHFADLFKVLASMVRHPEFPAERFASESEVIRSEARMYGENPDSHLLQKMLKLTFPVNPLGIPIIGYPEQLSAVNREIMVDYYRRRYAPNRIFWVAVGAVKAEEVFAAVRDFCGDWRPGRLDEPFLPPEPEQPAGREQTVIFADPMARLGISSALPGEIHPDIPAVELLAGILGGGDASRLNRVLRREKELAGSVEAFSYLLPTGGVLGIRADCTPARLAKLEKALLRELAALGRGELSREEVEREKLLQLADRYRYMRSNRGIASLLSSGIHAANSPCFARLQLEKLKKVGRDEIIAVAGKYLAAERLCMIRQSPGGTLNGTAGRRRPAALQPEELASGSAMRLFRVADASVPLIDFILVLPGGALWEPAGQGGISSLLARTLATGCEKYPEDVLARKIENAGGNLSLSPGMNTMTLQLSAPRRRFGRLFELLIELLSAPVFPERPFRREKANLLEELDSRLQQPAAAADLTALELLYGNYPYAGGAWERSDSIAALTAADCRNFHAGMLAPERCIAGFGGDIAEKDCVELIGRLAAALPRNVSLPELPPEPVFPARPGRRDVFIDREQSAVAYSLPGLRAQDLDCLAFHLLDQAENGLSGRIFKSVREDHGLAYRVEMQLMNGLRRGRLTFAALTSTDQAELALRLLQQEVEKLSRSGLSEAEFTEARTAELFRLDRQAGNPESALFSLLLEAFYGGGIETLREKRRRLEAFSRRECNHILRKHLKDAVGQSVIAGRRPSDSFQRPEGKNG